MATRSSNLIVMIVVPGCGAVVMPGPDPGIHQKKNHF
jgi:hypothetical protein